MYFVSTVNYIPEEGFFTAIDIPFGLSCKCNWVSVYIRSAKHPYITFISYSGHASSLAVRHCEIHVGWVVSHEKRQLAMIYPMTLLNLSEVVWTEVRGHFCSSLQRNWVYIIRHVCKIMVNSLPPMPLLLGQLELGDLI